MIEQLRRQLSFLARSSDAYDSGYHDEAIRLSVVLRVLFHSTSRQTSLLKTMKLENLELLSTCPQYNQPKPPPGTMTADLFYGIAPITTSAEDVSFAPRLGKASMRYYLPFNDWWQQIIFKPSFDPNSSFTRCRLVTTTADKEGAHIDPSLTPEYEAMMNSGITWSVSSDNYGTKEGILINAHYAALRQISFEVLNSPDLQRIAYP